LAIACANACFVPLCAMKVLQFGTVIVIEPLTVWLAAVVVVVVMVVGWPAVVELHIGRSGLVPEGSHIDLIGAVVVVVVVAVVVVAVVVVAVWPAVVVVVVHGGRSGFLPDGSHIGVVVAAHEPVMNTSAITTFDKIAMLSMAAGRAVLSMFCQIRCEPSGVKINISK
jgi:hypothetical protein